MDCHASERYFTIAIFGELPDLIKGKQSKEEILHTMISNDYVRHTNIYTKTYIYEATCEMYMHKTTDRPT